MARQNFSNPNMTQLPDAGFTISPTMPDDAFRQKAKPVIGETEVDSMVEPLGGGTTIVDVDLNHKDNVLRTTGWLVCTKGSALGQDFRLHNGWNYIGRDESLDVCLKDQMVDRRPTVKVAYDDRSRSFTAAPCEGAKNLVYMNDAALFGPCPFKAYDRLVVGETELMLVPLCNEKFSWND